MNHMPRVKSVMTAFPYSIEAKEAVESALELMRSHNIRHLPVTEDGALSGIISERDIKVAELLNKEQLEQISVKDICHSDPFSVDLNASLSSVLEQMSERKIGSAVVMKGDKVAGIFTTTDACTVLMQTLRKLYTDRQEPLDRA